MALYKLAVKARWWAGARCRPRFDTRFRSSLAYISFRVACTGILRPHLRSNGNESVAERISNNCAGRTRTFTRERRDGGGNQTLPRED